MRDARDFWTRRRAAVAAEVEAETAAREDAGQASEVEAVDRLNEMSDAEALEALHLPEPESLVTGDDFSAFLRQEVPARLKRRALRALWRTNPVLANLDGLVDYDADFTDKATVVENLKTAYQVGRGMLAHVEKLAAEKEAASALEAGGAPEAGASEADASETDASKADVAPEPTSEPVAVADSTAAEPERETEHEDDPTEAPMPRRMVFGYGDSTA